MRVETVLNRVEKFKSFVYGRVRLVEESGRQVLLVDVRPRVNGRAICAGCKKRCPGYDTLEERRFEFVPLWGIPVFFVYAMRRVECDDCGVTVEAVPWAEGKHHLTNSYGGFLAGWAKRLSWEEVARAFRTTWENVFRSVEKAVQWGLEHRDLSEITAIGIDEILWRRPYRYLTLVYQINDERKRLLWIAEDRTEEALEGFFALLGEARTAVIQFICTDMWKPYLNVVARTAKKALNILDRFHIMAKISKAIDKVRAKEAKELAAKGYEPILTHSRWCLLKRPENRTEKEETKLADLVQYNLRAVRSHLLKEDFQPFWDYVSPYWAGEFLDRWCRKVMRSRIEPMKAIARMLRSHRSLILNWFKARSQIALGAVEGLNCKAKVVTRRSYGFRTLKAVKIALYHTLGDLPEPAVTHRFC